MRRILATTAITCAAVISLAGCSSSSPKAGPAPTTSATIGATTTTTPTTAPATAPATSSGTTATTTPTGTSTGATPIFTTPEAAAKHLYNAWAAKNKAEAAQGATPEVVTLMFAEKWKSGTYFFGGCSTDTECDYNYSTGAIQMIISGNPTEGYMVVSVTFGSAG